MEQNKKMETKREKKMVRKRRWNIRRKRRWKEDGTKQKMETKMENKMEKRRWKEDGKEDGKKMETKKMENAVFTPSLFAASRRSRQRHWPLLKIGE